MSSKYTLKQTNDFAPHYDSYISRTSWYGAEMVFGLMYEWLKPGENLLDLGIGTGLSSLPFKNAGLNIYGIDGSEEMIRICQQKGFVEDIRQADLEDFKSPYGVATFDHVISIGVFHLVGKLKTVFSEVARSTNKDSLFAFTVDPYDSKDPDSSFSTTPEEGVFAKKNPESGIWVYQHSNEYIFHELENNGFRLLKQTEFLAYRDSESGREYYFAAYVAIKSS